MGAGLAVLMTAGGVAAQQLPEVAGTCTSPLPSTTGPDCQVGSGSLAGKRLTGKWFRAVFTSKSLQGSRLEGEFNGAVFGLANLTDANLTAIKLGRAGITGGTRRPTDFSMANLTRANLANVQGSGSVSGPESERIWARFNGANLTSANLTNFSGESCEMTGANLSLANLTGATLRSTNLQGANLTSAAATNADLRNANLRNTNLTGAIFTNANLMEANLQGANTTSTVFLGAQLTGATWKNGQKCGLASHGICLNSSAENGWKTASDAALTGLRNQSNQTHFVHPGSSTPSQSRIVQAAVALPDGAVLFSVERGVAPSNLSVVSFRFSMNQVQLSRQGQELVIQCQVGNCVMSIPGALTTGPGLVTKVVSTGPGTAVSSARIAFRPDVLPAVDGHLQALQAAWNAYKATAIP